MLTPDEFSTPRKRKKAHLIKSLLGSEVRLKVWRHSTRTAYGHVVCVALDEAVAPLVVEGNGAADGVRVDASGPADVAPPRLDLGEVVQRAVPSGDQVLDHLFGEARPPDALVQQRSDVTGRRGVVGAVKGVTRRREVALRVGHDQSFAEEYRW